MMKKYLLFLAFLAIAVAGFSQEIEPVFHPIDAKRPQKTYFASEIRRMQLRNVEALLRFSATEFGLAKNHRVAVLLNGEFVGSLDAAGLFTQVVDDKKLLEIPLDSVRMVVSEYDPAFQTRHSTANFFGKTNVLVNLPKPSDTIPFERYEPERIVLTRHVIDAEYQELAAVAVRGGWFLGSVTQVQSFQAGAWLEIPITRRMALLAEFSYTNRRDSLGRFAETIYENLDYSMNEFKGRIEVKYYLRNRYQRPFLLAGAYVGRAKGHLVGLSRLTPEEYVGPKTGFGLRFGAGYQFFSGLYGAVSVSPLGLQAGSFLPAQNLNNLTVSVGWMIGQR